MENTIKLQTNSVLQVPFQSIKNDFTFIVNGEKYKTNKFVAYLLSPEISKQHLTDLTMDEYSITTKARGNFQHILDLLTFEIQTVKDSEIEFISEVITKLCSDKIDISINTPEVTLDNVFDLIKAQVQFPEFYSKEISNEIDFLSKHFYDSINKKKENLSEMSIEILEKIINNDKLQLENEDQLLKFINELSSQNVQYSSLYEYVHFLNVESSTISEFLSIFDINLMNYGIWASLSAALVKNNQPKQNKSRYKKQINQNEISIDSHNNLKGIFNYLMQTSNIKNEIDVTCSSNFSGNPFHLLDIENQSNDFYTDPLSNSWICFEFTNHKIIPSSYSIKSCYSSPGGCHLKNWVIEASNDKSEWIKIDEKNDCDYLNGSYIVHKFGVQNDNDDQYQFLRIRQTGENWHGGDCLNICSIEFYGKLI